MSGGASVSAKHEFNVAKNSVKTRSYDQQMIKHPDGAVDSEIGTNRVIVIMNQFVKN